MINSLKDFFKNKVKMRSGLNENIILVLLLIVSTIPLWLTDFPPLQDYPDWLYQGKIFADYNKPGADYKDYFSLKPVIIPNSSSTLLIGFFMNFVGPIISGKWMLCFWLIGMPLSYIYFFRSFRQPGSLLELFPFLLLYNIRFYHGNLNFLLSLPLFFFVTGYFQRRKSNFKFFDTIILMVLLCLVFIFHFMGFCFTLFALFVLSINQYKLNMKKYVYFIFALIPSLVLTCLYIKFQTGFIDNFASKFHSSIMGKVSKILSIWTVCFSFDNEPISFIIIIKMIINVTFLVFIFYLGLRFIHTICQGKWRKYTIELIGITFVIVALFLPPLFFYITDGDTRLLLVATFVLIPVVDVEKFKRNSKNIIYFMIVFFVLIIINSIQFYSKGKQYNQIYKEIVVNIKPGSKAFLIMGDFMTDRTGLSLPEISTKDKIVNRLVPHVAALMRIPYYYYINNDLAYPHIFQGSLFESKNYKIPLMNAPSMKKLYPDPAEILANIDEYDYVVIVGKPQIIEYFINFLSPRTIFISKGKQYAVLRVFGE